MTFTVSTEIRETLGLRKLCEDYAKNLWVPAHYTPEQAGEFALDQFRRAVAAEMKMLVVKVQEATV